MATRMQQRRGTAAQWVAANPVLADGEMGLEKGINDEPDLIKMGDGVSTWNQLPYVYDGRYLTAEDTVEDSVKLGGLDSSAYAQRGYVDARILPAGASRQVGIHFGAMSTWPTTGVRVGDRCYRTDLFCEFFWNDTAWRQTEKAHMTSAQRLALSAGSKSAIYIGYEIYETDTQFDRQWDGTYWEITHWHGNRTMNVGNFINSPTIGLSWPGAVIAHDTITDYIAWQVYAQSSTFSTAGDFPGGPSLFSYMNESAVAIRCNAKGTVQIEAFASSDGPVGFSLMSLRHTQTDGIMGTIDTRSQRGAGYAGSGLLDQHLVHTVRVMPGDAFNLRIYQCNTAGAPVTYPFNFLQAKYL